MSSSRASGGKGRRQLVMLISLFLLPPIAAYFAWQYISEHGVAGTTNHGTFVSPPRPLQLGQLQGADGGAPLDVSELKGRWIYLVYANGGCDQRCQQQLYLTRQTRIGINKDMPRVRRLLVLDAPVAADLAEQLRREHQDLYVAVRGNAAADFIGQFAGDGFASAGEQFFLIDPIGNLMMFYGADVIPKGLLRDLQKLLKTSQVG